MNKVKVRVLTHEEMDFFRKSDLGKNSASLGQLAIMGPADHVYVEYLNLDYKSWWNPLGFSDREPIRTASGGSEVPVVWSSNNPYIYLLPVARKLNIPYLHSAKDYAPLYFKSAYAEAFLKCFSYTDRALPKWYNEQSFASRWLGGMTPDFGSATEKSISNYINNVLSSV